MAAGRQEAELVSFLSGGKLMKELKECVSVS